MNIPLPTSKWTPDSNAESGTTATPTLRPASSRSGRRRYTEIRVYGELSFESLVTLRELIAAETPGDGSPLVMRLCSPGGVIAGAAEAAGMLRRATAVRDTTVIAEGIVYGAAYTIAIAATRLVASPSCVIGKGLDAASLVSQRPATPPAPITAADALKHAMVSRVAIPEEFLAELNASTPDRYTDLSGSDAADKFYELVCKRAGTKMLCDASNAIVAKVAREFPHLEAAYDQQCRHRALR